MAKYEVIFGGGYGTREIVEMEKEISDYGAIIDKLIDDYEEKGFTGFFISLEDTIEYGGEYDEDVYVVGGNHGLLLYHGGMLHINLLK